ncbi:nuclear transport factor 2 family protein [Streptomyces sp. NPDC054864]
MSLDVRDVLASGAPDRTRLLLAPDVVFHSPVADYSGREDVAHLLPMIGQCLSGVEPLREFTAAGTGREEEGHHGVTTFSAKVGEENAYGVLVQQTDGDGQLTEATLLIRPLKALTAAVSRMREALSADPLPSRR